MYINTFYSFKGGVGRTMALANVAVHLARRGRRVLLVDFDLEAPGLDTFPALRPEEPVPGLVDYVAEYLETDQAPDVRDFVGESRAVDNVLVMPSGAMAGGYAISLGQIDWGALYAEREGYLFFEDLKVQWREAFSPDYVLVDSRTGFTDTSGICTRQLPDAVTVFFFPNEQNLRGLAKVVADVRSEGEPPREKLIELRFVMSNVPDLDDEDDILISMKERFQRELAFDDEPLVVHRYDSLSLLNQAVFTLDRPKSRLAREYGQVGDRIVRANLADPDGAKQFIRERWRRLGRFRDEPGESRSSLAKEIRRIEALHREDGEVLFRLGELAERRELQNAESLLDKAINAGYRKPESYLERARARAKAGDEAGARVDALAVLDFGDLPGYVVTQAIRLLGGQAPRDIDKACAIVSLSADDQIDLAENLVRLGEGGISDAILRRLTEDGSRGSEERSKAASQLALNCIGSRRFVEAIELLGHRERRLDQMDIRAAFNYGMAIWGDSREVSKPPFHRVLELHATGRGLEPDANYLQCLAVSNWAAGHSKVAAELAQRAREKAESEAMIFSCWQYRVVRRGEFVADTEAILALIGGDEHQVPKFLVAAQSELPLTGAEGKGAGKDVEV